MFPQMEVWNDSCSCKELSYAIEHGACGATTNPVIVGNVLKKELPDWEDTIRQIIKDNPTFTEDEVSWKVIEALGTKASKLLLPQFEASNGQKGRISFQTNAKYYRSPELMWKHGCQLASIVPNSQIKAPASKAGIEAYEEMTYRGVSINGLIASESFINETLFEELSRDAGVNLFRLAMYTYGVGIIGYCTNGNRERYHEDLAK